MLKHKTADRYNGIDFRYWEEMLDMLKEYNPVNMAIGMPDFEAYPQSVRDALSDVALNGDHSLHQYTQGGGHPRLVNILAKLYSILLNREVDPSENVQITLGAFEGLYSSIFGLVNPGDEVIVLEPHYDPYVPFTTAAGGRPVIVPMKRVRNENKGKNEWKIDFNELESKFNDKTRIIIVNNPHNPLGKVFTRQELEKISELCIKYDVIVVSDEVYEWLTYDNSHIRMATLPGMFERTITLGSVGKAFSVTGWKCGWALASGPVMTALRKAHSVSIYLIPTPIQEAAARAFEIEVDKLVKGDHENLYWTQLAQTTLDKRNKIIEMLKPLGLQIDEPEGGYFLIVDCNQLMNSLDLSEFPHPKGKTFSFVKWLSKNGLQTLPLSVFYRKEDKHLAEGLLRLCFMKSDQSLTETGRVLSKLKDKISEKN